MRCAKNENLQSKKRSFVWLRDKFDKEFISFACSIVWVFIIQVVLSSKDVQAKTRKPTSNFFIFYIVRAHTTDHLISRSDIEQNSGSSSKKKDERIADWWPACAYWMLAIGAVGESLEFPSNSLLHDLTKERWWSLWSIFQDRFTLHRSSQTKTFLQTLRVRLNLLSMIEVLYTYFF